MAVLVEETGFVDELINPPLLLRSAPPSGCLKEDIEGF